MPFRYTSRALRVTVADYGRIFECDVEFVAIDPGKVSSRRGPAEAACQQGNEGTDGDDNAKVGTHDRMPLVKHARFVELLDQAVIHQSIDLNIEHAWIMQRHDPLHALQGRA